MSSRKNIRILIIDGHPGFKKSLKNLLNKKILQSEIRLVDVTKLKKAPMEKVDIALIDGSIRKMNCFELIANIHHNNPECQNIILVNHDIANYKRIGKKYTIAACIDKKETGERLLPLIERIIKKKEVSNEHSSMETKAVRAGPL